MRCRGVNCTNLPRNRGVSALRDKDGRNADRQVEPRKVVVSCGFVEALGATPELRASGTKRRCRKRSSVILERDNAHEYSAKN